MNRKIFNIAFILSTLTWVTLGHADDATPDKHIRFITTSAAGSPLDTMMRALGNELSEQLGKTIVVDNKPGGTGAVGMGLAQNSPADGHTVVSATGSTTFLMAEPDSRFSVDDFIFLRAMQTEPSSIAVLADSPYRSMQELIDAIKADPSSVNIGGFGVAGFHQYVLYRLEQAADFSATWIPYQGGNQAFTALLGGHVDAVVMTPSTGAAQILNGDVRLLGISSSERSSYFPDVPTFQEQGYDVVETIWRGVMVTKDTPQPAVNRLVEGLIAVETKPSWQQFMQDNRQNHLSMTQEEFQSFVAKEVKDRRSFLKSIQ